MTPVRKHCRLKNGSALDDALGSSSGTTVAIADRGLRRASCDIIKRMSATLSNLAFRTHGFQTDDTRLAPVHEKVLAGKRLDADDALALYRTGDILAVGWMANSVRERMHGDKTYFNVNRHINPTNVCVAACRLCAFGRKKDAPG